MNFFYYSEFSVIKIPLQNLSDLLYQSLVLYIPNTLECQSIVQKLLAYYLQVDVTDYILNTVCTISHTIYINILNAIDRLKKQEPIQYVIGISYFSGNRFKVTPDVLIPRPETEEWVIYLTNQLSDITSILDIGTGSGCIAITLKQNFPNAIVEAIDISKPALKVASYNANYIGVEVHFTEVDMLIDPFYKSSNWSLIVSNPPYVLNKEKFFMNPNVLYYEPNIALFVDDNDPLIFHRRIIELASIYLITNGILCLEINESLGKNIVDILYQKNFKKITLHKDIHQKERWITASYGYT